MFCVYKKKEEICENELNKKKSLLHAKIYKERNAMYIPNITCVMNNIKYLRL